MPITEYQSRISQFEKSVSKQKTRLSKIMYGRILSFAALITVIFLSIYLNNLNLLFLCILPVIAFAILIKKNAQEKTKLLLLENILSINHQEIACIQGDYSSFDNGKEFMDTQHTYSHDLDLFGDNSLFQFLNRTTSNPSKRNLAKLLNHFETNPQEIAQKQASVKELTDRITWRQDFRANGLLFQSNEDEIEQLMEWNPESIPLIKNEKTKQLVLWGIPLFMIGSLLATSFALIPASLFALFIIIPLGIVGRHLKTINQQHAKLSRYVSVLNQHNKLSSFIEEENFSSEKLISLKQSLLQNNKSASEEIKKLAVIAQQLDNRSNPIFAILMNALFLWDLQYVSQLKKWLSVNSNELTNWFNAVYEMELYCSLANYSYNHPNYVSPILSEHTPLKTLGLAHPLLLSSNRVENNFNLESLQEFVIITGANMAGKSTFLRAVGVNLILAMTGAPVCASEFTFKPLSLFSSMRTSDSLSDNESYFYSELKRLQLIVTKLKKGEQLFIILDEILKGTNSKDKAEGSKKFVSQLMQYQTSGIIATHDLSLCTIQENFPDQIQTHYFDVEIEADNLIFDYTLKPGICSNMNAEFLMKKMGITE